MYREMAFISYYFHWSEREVMCMDHAERRRWCTQISSINRSLNPDSNKREKSILDMKASNMR